MSFDRSILPLPKKELEFSLPKINKRVLSNGLNILFVKREFLPIVRVNLISNCGSFFDPNEKKGLANLFAMLIDEGAAEYNSLELSEEFEILGSSFDSSCSHDNLILSLRTLSENFNRSLELLGKIILAPHLNEQDFQRERRKVEVRLLQQRDEPDKLASLAFSHLIHGNNSPYAFSSLGYEDTVNNIKTDLVREFYKNNFNPNRSYIIVVGNIDENELIDSFEQHLSSWKNSPITPKIQIESAKTKKSVAILHKEGAVQSEIRIGHLSSGRITSDYYAKTLMNTILGGQFTSRINLNLRENKGYTYGASSNYSYYKHAGEFCVSTSVSNENTLSAVNEIMNELKKIKDGVTPVELDFSRSSIIRRFPSQFESAGQIAANLSLLVIHGLAEDYFDTYLDNIRGISIAEVNQAAINNIKLDEMSIVLAGDKNKLLSQFKSSGLGDVFLVNQKGEVIERI
jgi:zinc protease